MNYNIRTTLLLSVLLFLCPSVMAQKKQLTPQQMWDNSVRITDYVYQVSSWDGDIVTFLGGNPDGERFAVQVNGKNGKMQRLSEVPKKAAPSAGTSVRVNGTHPAYAPDSTYIAYTRDRTLYTIRLSDSTETRLTFDGGYVFNPVWSPDSKQIAFFRSERSDSSTEYRSPRPGDPLSKVKAGVVSPEGGAIVWAKVDNSEECYLTNPLWRPDSKALWLQWMNRLQNHLKIFEADPTTGDVRQIYEECQQTWIDTRLQPRVLFLESGKGFIVFSDKSGWGQLYLHDMDGKLVNPLTNGEFNVRVILRVDEKEKMVYFICNKDNMIYPDLYKVGLDGKKLQRLTFGDYAHEVSISPNGKYFVTTYSNIATPQKVALYTTQGKLVCEVQDTKTENFDLYERPKNEIIIIKSNDGKFDLPMRIIWPLNMEPGKKYPVALDIYGGPGARNVRGAWRTSEVFGGIKHQYAKEGLIQVQVDHRGAGHNGKAGENCMYLNLGYWEMQDFTQCVQWLIQNKQADPEKIFITGRSYGGYLTCYALTYGADTFTHGIAGASVTDWLLYNNFYSEKYMSTPQLNPEGYKNSAVQTHAHKYKGKLLLTHGLKDYNVLIQNIWELVKLFQEQNKEFELMVYPQSGHPLGGTFYSNSEIRFIYRYLFEKPVPSDVLNAFQTIK